MWDFHFKSEAFFLFWKRKFLYHLQSALILTAYWRRKSNIWIIKRRAWMAEKLLIKFSSIPFVPFSGHKRSIPHPVFLLDSEVVKPHLTSIKDGVGERRGKEVSHPPLWIANTLAAMLSRKLKSFICLLWSRQDRVPLLRTVISGSHCPGLSQAPLLKPLRFVWAD